MKIYVSLEKRAARILVNSRSFLWGKGTLDLLSSTFSELQNEHAWK